MVTQVVAIPWNDWGIAVPAFLAITFMPFTYSITNGIGMGLISYAVIRTAQGRIRDVNVFVWVVAILFAIYFAIHPIEQLLGIA
jgi:AGZA family xanthine/uracil permease-like MFS transporter